MGTQGVILAAGKSSRMSGESKMTMDLNGRTVIRRSIDSLRPFCNRIIVVTGLHVEAVMVSAGRCPEVIFVYNPDCEKGMFSSLRMGLRHTEAERVLILPGDCPFITHEVCEKLLQGKGNIILPAYHGKRGHPVLLSHQAIEGLLADEHCQSLQEYICANKAEIIAVDCPEILWDIDTPEDYAKAVDYFQTKEAR
ncbi:nucleotidyltransferase family protein [Trichococcus collinsii]|uniref:Molybdenum cofactor cytidylyltransferase n=1 Tax=Trichococcus collinsii TaxID=157076 RepID=A0AB37ZZF5_9LACT|nr:nucleotidyltransferase family protein [Trichococcus collinsii]CZR06862.1 nucleotide-diphospho-sugar transferases [Trichococcus collinsii]SEA30427.1 molybdenum cofactor cytidylyltransferase [Trichococcus collinsii]